MTTLYEWSVSCIGFKMGFVKKQKKGLIAPSLKGKLGFLTFHLFASVINNQPVLTSPAATPLIVSNTSVTKSSDGFDVFLNA